jgi:hypothetical protein
MKVVKIALSALIFVNIGLASAAATEMDVLVNKLVDSGMLTPAEGQIVSDDAKTSRLVPDWTQKISPKEIVRLNTQDSREAS